MSANVDEEAPSRLAQDSNREAVGYRWKWPSRKVSSGSTSLRFHVARRRLNRKGSCKGPN